MTATFTPETRARLLAQVEEGKQRAREREAELTDEQRLAIALTLAKVGPGWSRVFCGPDNGKGRQAVRCFTQAEVDEWLAADRGCEGITDPEVRAIVEGRLVKIFGEKALTLREKGGRVIS